LEAGRKLARILTTRYPAAMEASTSQRIAELRREIESIQELNAIYRSQKYHSYQDKAAYEKRKIKLEDQATTGRTTAQVPK
jgi:hypothetical protein